MIFSKKIKIKESASPAGGEKVANSEKEKAWLKPEGQLAVDVYETDSDFVIVSAIAGVRMEDLDIAIEKDILIIKGYREKPSESGERNYLYQECYWGSFSRKIILPEDADITRVEAVMENGVLTIRMPKIQREKKRKIVIK